MSFSICPTTGKRAMREHYEALRMLEFIATKNREDVGNLHPYQCPHCALWHVGHLNKELKPKNEKEILLGELEDEIGTALAMAVPTNVEVVELAPDALARRGELRTKAEIRKNGPPQELDLGEFQEPESMEEARDVVRAIANELKLLRVKRERAGITTPEGDRLKKRIEALGQYSHLLNVWLHQAKAKKTIADKDSEPERIREAKKVRTESMAITMRTMGNQVRLMEVAVDALRMLVAVTTNEEWTAARAVAVERLKDFDEYTGGRQCCMSTEFRIGVGATANRVI